MAYQVVLLAAATMLSAAAGLPMLAERDSNQTAGSSSAGTSKKGDETSTGAYVGYTIAAIVVALAAWFGYCKWKKRPLKPSWVKKGKESASHGTPQVGEAPGGSHGEKSQAVVVASNAVQHSR